MAILSTMSFLVVAWLFCAERGGRTDLFVGLALLPRAVTVTPGLCFAVVLMSRCTLTYPCMHHKITKSVLPVVLRVWCTLFK